MCLTEYLKAKKSSMAPTENLIVDAAWITWVLAEHGCDCVGKSGVQPGDSVLGYSTADLAKLFKKSESTIRTWCGLGIFGDPDTLKPNSKGWRVPVAALATLQEKLANGYTITAAGLLAPESVGAPRTTVATDREAEHTSAAQAGNETKSQRMRKPKAAKGSKSDYGSWRRHLPK